VTSAPAWWSESDDEDPWDLVAHAANPKSSARAGARRMTPEMRLRIPPSIERELALDVFREEGDLSHLAEQCEVFFQTDRGVRSCPIFDFSVPPGHSLRQARRIGTYRDAPNRIAMYATVRDGFALHMAAESLLELGWFRELDFRTTTQWMQSQPFVLMWPLRSLALKAYQVPLDTARDACLWQIPDLLVLTDDGWTVYGVKPTDPEEWHPYVRFIFRLSRMTLALAGVRFEVAGGMTLQRLKNLRAIANLRWHTGVLRANIEAARRTAAGTLGGVADSAGGNEATGRATALCLLAHGLSADLDQRLLRGTTVSWAVP